MIDLSFSALSHTRVPTVDTSFTTLYTPRSWRAGDLHLASGSPKIQLSYRIAFVIRSCCGCLGERTEIADAETHSPQTVRGRGGPRMSASAGPSPAYCTVYRDPSSDKLLGASCIIDQCSSDFGASYISREDRGGSGSRRAGTSRRNVSSGTVKPVRYSSTSRIGMIPMLMLQLH